MEILGSYTRILPSLHNVAHLCPPELHAKLNICCITVKQSSTKTSFEDMQTMSDEETDNHYHDSITRNLSAPLVTDPPTSLHKLCVLMYDVLSDRSLAYTKYIVTACCSASQLHSDLVCVQLQPPTTTSHDFLRSLENVLSPMPVHMHGMIFRMK